MRARGKRVAILAGAVAIGACLAAAIAFDDDIRWWWRLRRANQVEVEDFFVGHHILKGTAATDRAREATKRLIRSLPPQKSPESGIVGYMSAVYLYASDEPEGSVFTVRLGLDPGGCVRCAGARYTCRPSEWLGYVRDLLTLLAPELLGAWRGENSDPDERFRTAAALALVAPGTEGLVEFLCDALEGKHESITVWLLGEVGPLAAGAVPALERAASDAALDEWTRVGVKEALAKIR